MIFRLFAFVFLVGFAAHAAEPPGYYDSAQGKTGAATSPGTADGG